MGYAAEKKEADRKWALVKRSVLAVVFALLLALLVYSAFVPPDTWKYRFLLPDTGKRADGEMRIHFVDVGQGDATVIELPDGKIALIDGGDGSKTTEYALMRYLNALEIEIIDYLIVTHADSDHCGALDVVLEYKEVKNAFLPLVRETVNAEYAAFYAALAKEEGCSRTYSQSGIALGGEDYTFTFLYPYAQDIHAALENGTFFDGNSNACSAALWLDYNGVSALFAGDLSAAEEGDGKSGLIGAYYAGLLGDIDLAGTEILKVGHHGSASATGEPLLRCLSVETAVISCGENAYGHPAASTIERLEGFGASVFRTDLDGSVIVGVEKDKRTHTTRALGK